jgi:hypothetical protein
MAFEHVVAKHHGEIVHKMVKSVGFEQFERFSVDVKHPDLARAVNDTAHIFSQEGADILHAFGTPLIELPLHPGKILDPHGNRREIENGGVKGLHVAMVPVSAKPAWYSN